MKRETNPEACIYEPVLSKHVILPQTQNSQNVMSGEKRPVLFAKNICRFQIRWVSIDNTLNREKYMKERRKVSSTSGPIANGVKYKKSQYPVPEPNQIKGNAVEGEKEENLHKIAVRRQMPT